MAEIAVQPTSSACQQPSPSNSSAGSSAAVSMLACPRVDRSTRSRYGGDPSRNQTAIVSNRCQSGNDWPLLPSNR